ncbi:hypothetical protein B0H12DRAFT_1121487 [Mycena haematopus]|nr:hypothetical protein B0H12DRAFT_1121487 [Mycena haematopus]
MFALRFAPLFLFAASFVSGTVVAEKRASTASVETVFNTLKASTDTILPQISSQVSGGTASDATVTPLIAKLTAALNTASLSLATLPPAESRKRQSDADVAALLAGVVTDISTTLELLTVELVPVLDVLLVSVDVALNEVLVGVDVVLTGVVTLVSGLLVSVGGVLDTLGLSLILLTLGL